MAHLAFLKPDDRLTATPGVFPSWRGVPAQPLIYAKRLNLPEWAGVPVAHIRYGLRLIHLDYRQKRHSTHAQRMARYARKLAACEALLAACKAPRIVIRSNEPTPF